MLTAARTSISFTGPEVEYLRAESERLGISMADVVRRVVDAHRGEGRPEIAVSRKRKPKVETVENVAPASTAQEEPDAAPVPKMPELVAPHQAQRQAEPAAVPAPVVERAPESEPSAAQLAAAAEEFTATVRRLPLEQKDLVVLVDALVKARDTSAPGYLITKLTALIGES